VSLILTLVLEELVPLLLAAALVLEVVCLHDRDVVVVLDHVVEVQNPI